MCPASRCLGAPRVVLDSRAPHHPMFIGGGHHRDTLQVALAALLQAVPRRCAAVVQVLPVADDRAHPATIPRHDHERLHLRQREDLRGCKWLSMSMTHCKWLSMSMTHSHTDDRQ